MPTISVPAAASVKPVIAVGHAALDDVYGIDAFPASPTKLRARTHLVTGGGMAANAAAAVGRLGGPSVLWSRIGNDEAGALVLKQLASAGVDTAHVRVFDGLATPMAAVIVDKQGERLIVSEDDHAFPVDPGWLPAADVAKSGAVMSDLSWLEGTRVAFAEARTAKVPCVLDIDLGSGQLLDAAIETTTHAIFSQPALRRFVSGGNDRERLARLVERGVVHAGVTCGASGYHWLDRGGRSGTQPAFVTRVVDTTGAGDAFHGAFAWALSAGCDEPDCARIGAAAAAMCCRKLGARDGLPTRAELEEFLGTAADSTG